MTKGPTKPYLARLFNVC